MFSHPLIAQTPNWVWRNFHDNVEPKPCLLLDLDVETRGTDLSRQASVVKAMVSDALAAGLSLRPLGSGWSLSDISRPGDVAVNPWRLSGLQRVPADVLTAHYRDSRGAEGYQPVYIQGGTEISTINRVVHDRWRLALQTSGAADGHRIAGCIATGTHGAAVRVGAVHDTVLALHVFVGGRSLFIHRATDRVFEPQLIDALARECGVEIIDACDDELFYASQVGLGSLGFVFGVVVECAPLYMLERSVLKKPYWDDEVWQAVEHLHTRPLHPDRPEDPFGFSLTLNPHHQDRDHHGAFVSLRWKIDLQDPSASPPRPPRPPPRPSFPTHGLELIGALSDHLDGDFSSAVVRRVLTDQLANEYHLGAYPAVYPGEAFGPTSLPPGQGLSTELCVESSHARRAVEIITEVIDREAGRGHMFLGPIGLRFVAGTKALLGMNIFDRSCFIELPCIDNEESKDVISTCWSELRTAGVNFTCHWGQLHDLNRPRLDSFFGGRTDRWVQARNRILATDAERATFSSPLIRQVGLE